MPSIGQLFVLYLSSNFPKKYVIIYTVRETTTQTLKGRVLMTNYHIYYGINNTEQLRMTAQSDIQANANAVVYAEVLRQSDRRRLEQQRQLIWEAGREQRDAEARRKHANWCGRHMSNIETLQSAITPNIPETHDEALQVIDYINTNKEMPAPWNDVIITKVYQKLIEAWMQDDTETISSYTEELDVWWHQSLIAVYMKMTKYPYAIPFVNCLPKFNTAEHQQYTRSETTATNRYMIMEQRASTDLMGTQSYGRQLTAYWDYLTTYNDDLQILENYFETPTSVKYLNIDLTNIFTRKYN